MKEVIIDTRKLLIANRKISGVAVNADGRAPGLRPGALLQWEKEVLSHLGEKFNLKKWQRGQFRGGLYFPHGIREAKRWGVLADE